MPELPEVETVVQTLKPRLEGKRITGYRCLVSRIERTPLTPIIDESIQVIRRRGKYIIFELDVHLLIVHLRMEGKFFIKKYGDEMIKHEHVELYFSDDSVLRYHDVRKFGTMDCINKDVEDMFFSSLGVEPLSEDLSVSYLMSKAKSQKLKAYLLDQSIIAGLGNIYVNEVMFLMKKHPEITVDTLQVMDFERMIEAIQSTLNKAIALGGTTIRSYTSSLGVTGRFQNELLVHGKEFEDCPNCGSKIAKIKVVGRGTYLCEQCQRR